MLRLLMAGLIGALRQPYLSHSRQRGRLVRPLILGYAVTWRCNARCIMCDTWRTGAESPDTARDELDPDELDRILARNADFLRGVRKIGITGGEPFLRSDLVDIIRVINRRLPKARISLVSNGLLSERILKALARVREFFPELIFSVSLDGLGPVHNEVRGIPGAYDKALATIKGARKLGFTVTSGMTVSHLNYHQVQPLSRLLAGIGVDFSCNLQERGANFHNQGRARELAPEHKRVLHRTLADFSHHYYMDHVRRQLEGKPRTLPCYSGFSSYFITPRGEVNFCNLIGRPLGDLRRESFRAIADKPETWRMRRELADCKCWSQCEVKNSAAVAPWHVLAWMLGKPNKLAFLKHYANKTGLMPH